MMNDLRKLIESVEWGGEPPPRAKNEGDRMPLISALAALAYTRPGVWGHIEVPNANNTTVIAYRLRSMEGIDARARGTSVWFRYSKDGEE